MLPKIAAPLIACLYCLSLCGCRSTSLDVRPACAKPAPLIGHYDPRTPGYEVGLMDPRPKFRAYVGPLEKRLCRRFSMNGGISTWSGR